MLYRHGGEDIENRIGTVIKHVAFVHKSSAKVLVLLMLLYPLIYFALECTADLHAPLFPFFEGAGFNSPLEPIKSGIFIRSLTVFELIIQPDSQKPKFQFILKDYSTRKIPLQSKRKSVQLSD